MDAEMREAEVEPLLQSTPLNMEPGIATETQVQSAATIPQIPAASPAATPLVAPARSSPRPSVAPTQPHPHGSSTRVYLNTHVTPHLLEAMKHLAVQEPEKPLKWLAEFLSDKSREVEGS